jgi:Na+-transporting methylmalonyl-CoA/oxaloacetate decarboxylase beta subunit
MPIPSAIIDSTGAVGWSVGGAIFAYVIAFILPELAVQRHREEKTGEVYRPRRLTWVLGIILLACAAAAGVLIAKILNPCSAGDAAVCGLGSISFVGGLSNLGSVAIPRV